MKLSKSEKIAFYTITQQNMGCSFDEWDILATVEYFDNYFEAVKKTLSKQLLKEILEKCEIIVEPEYIKIKEISNYLGILTLKRENDKFFWGIEDYNSFNFKEIPESLFKELVKHNK